MNPLVGDPGSKQAPGGADDRLKTSPPAAQNVLPARSKSVNHDHPGASMPRPNDSGATLRSLLVVVVSIFVLSWARDVILPLAMAGLVTFVLSPLVTRLERWRLPRVLAVLSIVTTMTLIAGMGVWVVSNQIRDLGEDLPIYRDNLVARIQTIRAPAAGGGENELAKVIEEISDEIGGEEDPDGLPQTAGEDGSTDEVVEVSPGQGGEGRDKPLRVRVVDDDSFGVSVLGQFLGPILAPLGTVAIVSVFTVFMLLQRDDIRDRLIRLAGTTRLNMTTQAFDEAAGRVSNYLLMLLLINGGYGVCVAAGLWAIGLPASLLWGLLAAVLRFIPFLGPWIAAGFPIALSLAVEPGWTTPLSVIGLFIVLELLCNNAVEPFLFGKSTGVSITAIVAMASFWTWLWGPLGLVLSMPLTVILVVVGRYVPQLAFLNILLGDAPALDTRFKYYQRLLAMDYHEAGEIAAETLREGTVEQLYMDVLCPALSLAERDRQTGDLPDERRDFVRETIRETVEHFGEAARTPAEVEADPGATPTVAVDLYGDPLEEPDGEGDRAPSRVRDLERLPMRWFEPSDATNSSVIPAAGTRVWCIPADDEADEIAGMMIAQLLTARGYSAEALPLDKRSEELLDRVVEEATDTILISAVAPGGVTAARRLCRKLRPQRPGVHLIVGLWNASGPLTETIRRLKAAGANEVVSDFQDAVTTFAQQSAPNRAIDSAVVEPGAAAGPAIAGL